MNSEELERLVLSLDGASGVQVFRYSNDLPGENRLDWPGDEPSQFSELARKLGNGVLYVSVGAVGDEEERDGWKDHRGELSWVEAAFLRDGIFHVKTWFADWVAELQRSQETDEEAGGAGLPGFHRLGGFESTPQSPEFIRRFKAEALTLVPDFLADAAKRRPPPDPNGYQTRELILAFYQRRLGAGSGYLGLGWLEGDDDAREVWQSVSAQIARGLTEAEQARVAELVPACVRWASEQGIARLAQSDAEVFLSDHGNPLSSWGRKELWRRAKLQMKVRR